jgi:hypothetical protein
LHALIFFKGGNNFVYIANPNALEIILRAEGKYPRRETNLSPYIQWILNKQNFAVPLPFKYVHYYASSAGLAASTHGGNFINIGQDKIGGEREVCLAIKSSPVTCRPTPLE